MNPEMTWEHRPLFGREQTLQISPKVIEMRTIPHHVFERALGVATVEASSRTGPAGLESLV
eukprot:6612696-Alexandrium_andersonii.AAC.1